MSVLEVVVMFNWRQFPFFFFSQASRAGRWGVRAWARTVSWLHSFFSPHYSAFFVTVNLGLFGNFSHQHQTLSFTRWDGSLPKAFSPSHPDIPAPLFHSADPSADCQGRRPGNPFLTDWLLNPPHQRPMTPSEALRTINFLLPSLCCSSMAVSTWSCWWT